MGLDIMVIPVLEEENAIYSDAAKLDTYRAYLDFALDNSTMGNIHGGLYFRKFYTLVDYFGITFNEAAKENGLDNKLSWGGGVRVSRSKLKKFCKFLKKCGLNDADVNFGHEALIIRKQLKGMLRTFNERFDFLILTSI